MNIKIPDLPPDLFTLGQVCILTNDIRGLMEQYASLGIGPFKVYKQDCTQMEGVQYRGEPARYSLEVAWAPLGGPVTLELLQPNHEHGGSIYKEFMDEHGEGMHHLGVNASDYQAAYDELIRRGFNATQGGPIIGRDRTGRYDYFDTEKVFGTCLEILDMPNDLGPPEYVYPE